LRNSTVNNLRQGLLILSLFGNNPGGAAVFNGSSFGNQESGMEQRIFPEFHEFQFQLTLPNPE
jgi:hypothetical protein